jgi:4-amino-4-deoxy-L-arabinose transferase-like glycosyltransferase
MTAPADTPARTRSFLWKLTVITAAALAFRVGYAIWYDAVHNPPGGDAFYYHYQANAIAGGHWFIEPYAWKCFGQHIQSAAHPPLYPLYLSAFSLVGAASPLWHRLATTLLGAAVVWLIGLTGREMRSERLGLVAAVIAAIYPALWINDALLMSETIFAFTVALLVWFSYRYINKPSLGRALWVGFALALTALARAEAIMFAVILVIPVLLKYGKDVQWKPRLLRLGAALGITAITVAPIVIHNMARFNRPVFLSNGLGSVLAVANCEPTYNGSLLGLWDIQCAQEYDNITAGRPLTSEPPLYGGKVGPVYCRAWNDGKYSALGDESDDEYTRRKQSIDYIRNNADRLWIVLPARLGRTFEVYRPAQGIVYADFVEGRGTVASRAGQYMWYALALLSIAGAVILYRRKVALWPCGAMLASVVITTLLTYGNVRFRVELDTVLPLLSAAALIAAWDRWRIRRSPHEPGVPSAPEPAVTASVGEGGPTSAP